MFLTCITALLYPIAIAYKRGGIFAPLKVLALLTAVLDVIANYTEWALIFGWPSKGDHTITKRLKRMATADAHESRRRFASAVLVALDAAEPDGKH